MAQKHIRVLLPRNTQADHDVEQVGGSVLANVYNNCFVYRPETVAPLFSADMDQ